MKIIISAPVLKKFLKYVSKVAYEGFKINKGYIYFEVLEDCLLLQASNDKKSVSAKFNKSNYDFEIIKTGVFLINAYLLNELIQKLHNESLHISITEKQVLNIETNNSKTNINLADNSNWEKINFNIEGNPIELKTKIFNDINHDIAFAVGGHEGKPAFQGVGIADKKHHLVASATDTWRAAWKQIMPFSGEIDLIIPYYTINEINRLNDFDYETAKIIYNKNQILINLNDEILLLSNLIVGKFPDLTKQLDREFVGEIVCFTEDLIDAIEQCSVFRQVNLQYPIINFIVKNKTFVVASPQIETGTTNRTVETTKISGQDQNLFFQSRFLLNPLRSFDPKSRTHIKFSEKKGPILLQNEQKDQVFNLILPYLG